MAFPVTVHLPDDEWKAVERIAASEGRTADEIVRQSVKDYLFLRDFRALRSKLLPRAMEEGVLTDEDVFDRVS